MKFKATLIKLTIGYLLLIMLVSGLLSFALYKLGPKPLERRIEFGRMIFREDFEGPKFLAPVAIEEVKHRIALSLIYFNIAVLFLAGIFSYTLAKRELAPIQTAMEMQNRFASDAAHELRTPLTAMKTEIEVALRSGKITENEAKEVLESNLEEIEKLQLLSNSLLALSRYDESTFKERENVPIKEIVNEAIDRVRQNALDHEIEISTELENAKIPCQRDSLIELFAIILDNSIKYSPRGKRIWVTSKASQKSIEIEVRDEGYGIEEEDLNKIFDRFYRGKAPQVEKVEGHGLGLSIAKKIVELHGGTIKVSSMPSVGTIVTVTLPLRVKK